MEDVAPQRADAPPDGGTSSAEVGLLVLGIFLGSLGSVLINVGNNVQALGMGMVAEQKRTGLGLTPSKRPRRIWTMGTVTFVLGSTINFVAFVFAAAAVLAPLEAIQFVTNLLFARFVTKCEVTRKMVIGSSLIVVGTIGAVASGPMAVYKFSIAQLRGFWESPIWITFVIFAWTTSLAMQAYWHVQTRRIRNGEPPSCPPVLLPVLYAVSSALIGTQSVVQAKAFSELIELWLTGQALIWTHWFTYVVLLYFAVTVAFWLYRLNAALGKYDPLFIIPLLQASYIVLATLAGGIYFQEFQTLTWWQLLLFAAMIGVMFCGLYLLIPPISSMAPPTTSSEGAQQRSGKQPELHGHGHGQPQGGSPPDGSTSSNSSSNSSNSSRASSPDPEQQQRRQQRRQQRSSRRRHRRSNHHQQSRQMRQKSRQLRQRSRRW